MKSIRDLIDDSPDLWEELASESRPIVLYGTGNGADKILDELEKRHIPVRGIFASEGFVRTRVFRGFPVESLENLTKRLPEPPVILIAFGSSRPDVMEAFDRLEETYEVRMPDVPLFGGALFTRSYACEHAAELEAMDTLLEDEASRLLLRDMISYRLHGRLRDLKRTTTYPDILRLIPADSVKTVLDGGAFTGDTARLFLGSYPRVQCLWAVEPDPRSFRKLSAIAEGAVRPVHAVLSDREKSILYGSSGSRSSAVSTPSRRAIAVEMPAVTVDSLVREGPLDLLKLDVEGEERPALAGAIRTLGRDKPHLLLSLYHRSDDLWALPHLLSSETDAYHFYLRRVPCYPAWDLLLVAVRKNGR